MTKFMHNLLFLCVLVAICGCGRSSSKHSIKGYYILETNRNKPVLEQKSDTVLLVDVFEVAEGFNNNSLIYRNSEGRIESDYYRRTLTGKGQMLSSLTSQWLSDSGLFQLTTSSKSGITGSYRLKGIINSMYADMQDEQNARALLDIKIFLVDRNGKPLFWKDYVTQAPISDKTADAVIVAMNECVYSFLETLEQDLADSEF